MKELIESVTKLAEEESTRSMVEHPLFNSTHEGYAVLHEEVEEAEDELNEVKCRMKMLWTDVKNNNKHLSTVKAVKAYAINLAAESIQVAAMAQKFIDSEANYE